jgi:hypothetical protein
MDDSSTEQRLRNLRGVHVPLPKNPNSVGSWDDMYIADAGNGKVRVDVYGTDPQGNPRHSVDELDEETYEMVRADLLRKEQATLPTFSSIKSGNTLGRLVGETAPNTLPAVHANPPIEAETEEEGISGEQVLDAIQLGLDVIGLIPVVGEIADFFSAGISFARGDYVGATLSLAAAIPFAGWLATGAKGIRRGASIIKSTENAEKATEITLKSGKTASKRTHQAANGAKIKNVTLQSKKPSKDWKNKIEGKAQKTGTPGHQFRTYREAIGYAKDPKVEKVHLDHGYNRALGLDPKTISPNRRPDVTAIYSNKNVARVEVVSKTDSPLKLHRRNAALDNQLRAKGYRPLSPRVVHPTKKLK